MWKKKIIGILEDGGFIEEDKESKWDVGLVVEEE